MALGTEELKANFTDQLAQTEKQISELEANLEKAREYKTKLLGGIETLELLTKGDSPENVSGDAPDADGNTAPPPGTIEVPVGTIVE